MQLGRYTLLSIRRPSCLPCGSLSGLERWTRVRQVQKQFYDLVVLGSEFHCNLLFSGSMAFLRYADLPALRATSPRVVPMSALHQSSTLRFDFSNVSASIWSLSWDIGILTRTQFSIIAIWAYCSSRTIARFRAAACASAGDP